MTNIRIETNKIENKTIDKINETTKISFHRWMVKQNVVCPHHGIPLRNKTEWTSDKYMTLDRAQGQYAKW